MLEMGFELETRTFWFRIWALNHCAFLCSWWKVGEVHRTKNLGGRAHPLEFAPASILAASLRALSPGLELAAFHFRLSSLEYRDCGIYHCVPSTWHVNKQWHLWPLITRWCLLSTYYVLRISQNPHHSPWKDVILILQKGRLRLKE